MDQVTTLVVTFDQLAKFLNDLDIKESTDIGVAVLHQGDHPQTGACLVVASIDARNAIVIPTRSVLRVSGLVGL